MAVNGDDVRVQGSDPVGGSARYSSTFLNLLLVKRRYRGVVVYFVSARSYSCS
jgi:hypothetical protein